jgi:hypothetical protein
MSSQWRTTSTLMIAEQIATHLLERDTVARRCGRRVLPGETRRWQARLAVPAPRDEESFRSAPIKWLRDIVSRGTAVGTSPGRVNGLRGTTVGTWNFPASRHPTQSDLVCQPGERTGGVNSTGPTGIASDPPPRFFWGSPGSRESSRNPNTDTPTRRSLSVSVAVSIRRPTDVGGICSPDRERSIRPRASL